MKMNPEGIRDRAAWEKVGVRLPGYDAEKAQAEAVRAPRWVHFGIGNIFRVFIGGIADELLEQGELDRGITCVETFDYEVVDRIYRPYDNLALSVILRGDGTRDYKVLGSLAEAVKADCRDGAQWARLKEVFRSPDLQLISFTITEKGYSLYAPDGTFLPLAAADIEGGPEHARGAMAIVTAMLCERYLAGKLPAALVSMDNCSQNGSLLKQSVLTVAKEWDARGFLPEGFLDYIADEEQIAFLWTMIDKITPRPSDRIAADLEAMGVEGMEPVITSKRTYIAPFTNAEGPQYLVIEDRFPNGRPRLDRGPGVYLADRDTVNLSERMKVTACLNPVHSATGPLGVVLGEELFAHMLNTNPDILKMARQIAYDEGMKVIGDPKILSPKAFTDELFEDRFPNEYLGDTNLRLATDTSMGLGVRFGVTIGAYAERFGAAGCAEKLTAIPLGIAGWFRYLLGVDDEGQSYELAPDPLAPEIHEALKSVVLGQPDSLTDQLHPYLSNESIFFIDLYKAGVGEKIEGMFREMIAGQGAARETVKKYMA